MTTAPALQQDTGTGSTAMITAQQGLIVRLDQMDLVGEEERLEWGSVKEIVTLTQTVLVLSNATKGISGILFQVVQGVDQRITTTARPNLHPADVGSGARCALLRKNRAPVMTSASQQMLQ